MIFLYQISAEGPTRHYRADYAVTSEQLDSCAVNLYAYLLGKLLRRIERKMALEHHSISDTRFIWTMREQVLDFPTGYAPLVG